MEPVGERLKKIRLEKGITLEEAAQRTKIHLHVLKSIEDGTVDTLRHSEIYIRGFIKIYCKYLGVDHKEFLRDARESSQELKVVAAAQKTGTPAPKKPPMIKVRAVDPRMKERILFIVGVLVLSSLLVFGIVYIGRQVKSWMRNRANRPRAVATVRKTPSVSNTKKRAAEAAKAAKAKAALNPAASTGGQSLAIKAVSGIRLGIRAKEDCWVNLKVDGQLVFQGVLKKGRFETWQAKEKIEFSLGNALGVDLEVNGKLIPPLGRKGQAVKNAVINKDGLKLQ